MYIIIENEEIEEFLNFINHYQEKNALSVFISLIYASMLYKIINYKNNLMYTNLNNLNIKDFKDKRLKCT